jgi:DNA-binding CsgD family transcriptional regulator/ArsR family metal-binding transcriptional regulator
LRFIDPIMMLPKQNNMSRFRRFYDFSIKSTSVKLGERCWFAHFKTDGDFTHLFPYIQSTAKEVVHYETPEYIQFQMDDIICTLYPPNIVVSRLFYGREQALEFADSLIEFLNKLELRKSHITPNYKKFSRLHVPEILRFLPMTDCGKCGFRTCMAFAGAISRRKAKLTMCQDFPGPADVKIIYSVDDKNLRREALQIEVDLDLAGFDLAKTGYAESTIQTKTALKRQKERSTGLTGNRDGIIFKLSGRETEVLRLVTEGFTNKEIAQILQVSDNTVKSHITHIFDKLGVSDRTQAAVWAAQNELL